MKTLTLRHCLSFMTAILASTHLYGASPHADDNRYSAVPYDQPGERGIPSVVRDPRFNESGGGVDGRTAINFFRLIDQQFKFSIFPVIYWDSNRSKTITNLCESFFDLREWSKEEGHPLIYEECPKGYKVVQFRQKSFGLGFGLDFSFANSAGAQSIFGVSVGIAPIRGRYMRMERYAPSLHGVKELPAMSFPYSASDIDGWSLGDKVTYMSSGALLTYGSFRVGGVAAGLLGSFSTTYLAQGDWIVEVTKVNQSKVFVSITKSRIRALSAAVGNFVSSMSVTRFRNTDDGFSYVMDLSDPLAAKIYEDTIRGNLLPVQEVVQKGMSDTVYAVAKERSFAQIRRKRREISIPFIFGQEWNRSHMIKDSETYLFANGEKVDTDYGVFYKSHLKKMRTGRWGRNRQRISVVKSFSGTRFQITKQDGKSDQSGYFGEITFAYTNDSTNRQQFKVGLWHLYNATGLKEHLRVQPPPRYGGLGYAGIYLSAYLSQSAVERLIFLAEENHPAFRESFNLRSAKYHLLMMRKYKDVDNKKFVHHFSHFGRFMIAGQSTFKSILSLAPEMIQLRYKVEGEKFHSLERNFTFQDLEDQDGLDDDDDDSGINEDEEEDEEVDEMQDNENVRILAKSAKFANSRE